MDIAIISPGKKHGQETGALIADYEKRLRGRFDVSWLFPKPGTPDEEGAAIMKALSGRDFVVLFDGRGRATSSEGFAETIAKAEGSGRKRIVFVIGGAYGVSSALRERADACVSLSLLTFPHALVRLIAVEQLYRAAEILRGGRYHHA
ncbi:MAG: 23S rRNA (pseudouridine(1915)-N(3))-methyltransferase RlmH [Patescibacteria group bacterium]|nr:23S rRNA (pseudouridine(1915)-N(3))-methyltransferase RlmH [Patescibacteria group bacterium]